MTTGRRWLPGELGLSLNQREVDFVIPRLDADLPLSIDPFLLFKSRRDDLRAAHDTLVSMFRSALDAFRSGDEKRAKRLLTFPEVREIRLGYGRGTISGSGVGDVLSGYVLDVLRASPDLVARGLRHVEELQLVGVGIAEDRISDACANVLKEFLIQYTQRQCGMWRIPVSEGVPLEHIWSVENEEWLDGYVDLPIDPLTGVPILLVPRWIVRRLPWINFDDYRRSDFAYYLRSAGRNEKLLGKSASVEITRHELGLVDAYIDRKEKEAHLALPDAAPLLASAPDPTGQALLDQLSALPVGREHATEYQRVSLEFINLVLAPDIVDGEEQVRTADGVEIRDLVYTNNSDRPFLRYIATNYDNALVAAECKNVANVRPDDVNQLAAYLGDPIGRFGVILTRHPASEASLRRIRSTYGKGSPRKAIVILCDEDMAAMVAMWRIGRSPVDLLQRRYRELVQSID